MFKQMARNADHQVIYLAQAAGEPEASDKPSKDETMGVKQQEISSSPIFSPLQPPRRYLFGPGPSMVHPRVYEALSKPIVGHLDPYFFQVMGDIQQLLKPVFGTKDGVTTVLSGTGSAGMEAAVSNFVEPGAKFAVFANGYFCDRISEMGKRQGAQVVRFEKPWGKTFADEEAAEFIHLEKPQVVAYVHAETSTGALQSGNTICAAAHEAGALVIADCVTSLGGMPVNVDETGIDIACSCTQKGLSCPPGLIAEEGIANRWERHRQCHQIFVEAIEAMGLRMQVTKGQRIWTLNTVCIPDGVDDAKVRGRLLEEKSIEILGGFGPLAGKVFRIGIMGPLATEDHVQFLLDELKKSLSAEGYRPQPFPIA